MESPDKNRDVQRISVDVIYSCNAVRLMRCVIKTMSYKIGVRAVTVLAARGSRILNRLRFVKLIA